MKTALIAAFMMMSGFAASAAPLANDMTCAQTKAYYNQHGYVLIRNYSGDIIPIYGDRGSCQSGEEKRSVSVGTKDVSWCDIAYVCQSVH